MHPATHVPPALLCFLSSPPAGYRIFTADTDLASCSVNNPFAKCSTTQNKVMAIETDGSCAVRVFVLGDSQCSQVEDLAVVQG